MKSWLRKTFCTLAGTAVLSAPCFASEVSLVSGLYKSENNKSNGKKTAGSSTLELGGRYAEPFSEDLHWFAQGMLGLVSFSGKNAPSNSTNLLLKGGMRMYFNQYSQTLIPFISGSAGYKASTVIENNNEVETSGLFYYGDIGLRMEVGQNFFFEIETNLFESALWATTKTQGIDDGDATTTERDDEQTKMELYIDTQGAFQSTYVSVGMRL